MVTYGRLAAGMYFNSMQLFVNVTLGNQRLARRFPQCIDPAAAR